MQKLERNVDATAQLKKVVVESPEYKAGTKAFYDAHTVIIPCTVKEVIEEGNGLIVTSGKLLIVVNEDSGPYKKGEEMTVTGYHTYPRKHRIKREFSYRINCFYRWVK